MLGASSTPTAAPKHKRLVCKTARSCITLTYIAQDRTAVTVGPPSECASPIARRQQAAIYASPQAHKGPVSREKKSAATTIRTHDLWGGLA
jgi:hypothetical protein